MVEFPRELVESPQLVGGEMVELDVRRPRETWFGVLKGIGAYNHELSETHH